VSKIFDGFVTFPAGAGSGQALTMEVPLPPADRQASTGQYLVVVYSDANLAASVDVTLRNRIPFETPKRGYTTQLATVGPAPFLSVPAGGTLCEVATGWLIGASPAEALVTLTSAASATGGRVWVVVYTVGRAQSERG